MSRFRPVTPDMQRVLDVLTQARASATCPITQGDCLRALHGHVPPDGVCDALEALQDAGLITSMRHTRDGVTQSVYWPTGLKPLADPSSTFMETPMATLQEKIHRAIQARGPIDRHALVQQAGVKPGSLDTLAKPLVDTGKVLTRMLFSAEQGKDVKHWLTPDQAKDLDEAAKARELAGPPAADDVAAAAADQPDQLAAAYRDLNARMTATEAELSTAEADLQAADGWIAVVCQALDVPIYSGEAVAAIELLKAQAATAESAGERLGRHYQTLRESEHALRNDLAARDLILNHLAERLQVEGIEQIHGALDELLRAQADANQSGAEIPVNDTRSDPLGRLALLTYVDGYDLDLEYLLPTIAVSDAATEALKQVNEGNAERVVVVRVLGEAKRPAAVYTPMLCAAPAMPELVEEV